MSKEKKNVENINDDGSYVVKKSKKSNVLAFILCVVIAFIIWIYTVNLEMLEQKKATANATAAYHESVTAESAAD